MTVPLPASVPPARPRPPFFNPLLALVIGVSVIIVLLLLIVVVPEMRERARDVSARRDQYENTSQELAETRRVGRLGMPIGFQPVGDGVDTASGLPLRIRHLTTGYELALVPAGRFLMGSLMRPKYPPTHLILADYWMGITEVSNRQFLASNLNADTDTLDALPSDLPVVNISWHRARAWCDAMGMVLPTDAEWEKAARGPDGREYPWGDYYRKGLANADGISRSLAPVGSFPGDSSPYGCLDMAGNAHEWCADAFRQEYRLLSAERYPAPGTGEGFRVTRGGSYLTPAAYFGCYVRFYETGPQSGNESLGFRAAVLPSVAADTSP